MLIINGIVYGSYIKYDGNISDFVKDVIIKFKGKQISESDIKVAQVQVVGEPGNVSILESSNDGIIVFKYVIK